jgi:hypothetical protein
VGVAVPGAGESFAYRRCYDLAYASQQQMTSRKKAKHSSMDHAANESHERVAKESELRAA